MKASKLNVKNEEIKDAYLLYLTKSAKDKLKTSTAESKIGSVRQFETFTKYADFKAFDEEQGISFYDYLDNQSIEVSTKIKHLNNVRDFFYWYLTSTKHKKSQIEALNTLEPKDKDVRLNNRRELIEFPSNEEISKIFSMSDDSIFAKRDLALISFQILSAARVSAIATLSIGNIDLDKKIVFQDPLEGVETKRDKYIITKFMEFDDKYLKYLIEWVNILKIDYGFTDADPLFPKINEYAGGIKVRNEFYGDASKYNFLYTKICKKVGIKVYHPHCFRHYSIAEALKYVRTGEQFKALSQNIGHEDIITILEQYGNMRVNEYTKFIELIFTNKGRTDLVNFTDEELLEELRKRALARGTGF